LKEVRKFEVESFSKPTQTTGQNSKVAEVIDNQDSRKSKVERQKTRYQTIFKK